MRLVFAVGAACERNRSLVLTVSSCGGGRLLLMLGCRARPPRIVFGATEWLLHRGVAADGQNSRISGA
jgi:hypothetical protein